MSARREAFFLGAGAERRFCLVTRPAGRPRGAILHVHPFAEELNRSRRMVALAAQAFAQQGWLVLQIDLHGCGDSAGDFADATWNGWLEDIARACEWLRGEADGPVTLWTLRTGSLLASDWLARHDEASPLLCWQPVLNGRQYLTQFLRIRAGADLGEDGAQGVMAQLRASLAQGRPVAVAGYTLSAALAAGMEASTFSVTAGRRGAITLIEVASSERPAPTPAIESFAHRLRQSGVACSADAVAGPKFWQTPEVEHAPALIVRSVDALGAVEAQAA